MRIVFAGIIGRYPWGGVAWCSLMYLIGLRRLGHDVYYLEDTCECNYDPRINAIATDPGYALTHIRRTLEPFGFGDRWCYIDYTGRPHGMPPQRLESVCRSSDLFLVLSGGCWNWREHYLGIPKKVFIDSDPAFTQLAIHHASQTARDNKKSLWYVDFFRTYDHLFTFGANIGTARSPTPTGDFHWKHTWQPVCTDLWTPERCALPPRSAWTTVMTWTMKSFADIGGNKDREFEKVLGLARRCRQSGGPELELAINGPVEFLRGQGWDCVDAFPVSSDVWRYHSYLSSSRGEFSVAKHTYVESHSGWFSDRSECYMAAGRPVVVQDTGFADSLPAGEGLMAWKTAEEAFDALVRVEKDYARHAKKARAVACENFDDGAVLKKLLGEVA